MRWSWWTQVVGAALVLGLVLSADRSLVTVGAQEPSTKAIEKPKTNTDQEPKPSGAATEESDDGTTRSDAKPGKDKPKYVDELLHEAWSAAGVKPSPIASDAEFLRRAYLDLLGRIPNIKETRLFLDSKDKEKRSKLIEALLDHSDFPKNFANVWAVVLIGRADQGRNVNREAMKTWLRRQFAEGTPWDKMAFELINARGSNLENGAANFVLAHLEGDRVPLTSMTTRVFLGLQIQCTQCHDHPSNDWKQSHFWGINAFFKGVNSRRVRVERNGALVDSHMEVYDERTDAFSSYDRRNGMVGVQFPSYLDGRKVPEGTEIDRRLELAKMITDPANKDFARAMVNRMWAHFMGKGFVNPVDDFGDHNTPSIPELLDQLADDFRASGFNIKNLVRWITASHAYHLSSATAGGNDKDETLFSHMSLKAMSPEQLFESLIVATAAHKVGSAGDTDAVRDRWTQQFVTTFANDEEEEALNFQGTIPQALMMMNGELMDKAVSGKPGSFLGDLLEQAQLQRGIAPEAYIVTNLYLAALNRPPNSRELTRAQSYFRQPDKIAVMQDLFWALLNSNEFILVK